ncbi:MAG: hypothetical protein HW390_1714 [Candidatus Brocadiaceae bacterium]|nr:hypothetical protein [Candidatus Brocadiaceae bacterium]
MNLTEIQHDILKEIMNISVSKAATQLSVLLNDKIQMEVPEISFLTLSKARESMPEDEENAIIYQELTGMLSGRTYLVFQGKDSLFLAQAVLGDAFSRSNDKPQFYEHEAMMEIGNIVISACISTIANLLKDRIALSTPVYMEDSLPRILLAQSNDSDIVLLIRTTLHASRRDIPGTLVMVITSELAGSLINKLPRFFELIEKRP